MAYQAEGCEFESRGTLNFLLLFMLLLGMF